MRTCLPLKVPFLEGFFQGNQNKPRLFVDFLERQAHPCLLNSSEGLDPERACGARTLPAG